MDASASPSGSASTSASVSVSPTPGQQPKRRRVRSRSRSGRSSSSSQNYKDEARSTPPTTLKSELHGATLLNDPFVEENKWAWVASYCNRALLARLQVDVTSEKKAFEPFISSIKAVKFFSRKKSSDPVKVEEYRCLCTSLVFISPAVMMDKITSACPLFRKDVTHINQDSPMWKTVKTLLDNRWKYCDNPHHGDVGWHSVGGNVDMAEPEGAASLTIKLDGALRTDMMNGQAKKFAMELTQAVKETLGIQPRSKEDFIECDSPPLHDRGNTKIEMLAPEDTTNWKRAYTTEPPVPQVLDHGEVHPFSAPEKLAVQKASVVVPDVTWALPDFPGQFPLVFELKPEESFMEGMTQCFKQMLSKLHFQDAIFGIVLTPRHYVMLFAHKDKAGNALRVYLQNPTMFGDENNTEKFSTGKFFELVEMLCKIMDWAGRQSGKRK